MNPLQGDLNQLESGSCLRINPDRHGLEIEAPLTLNGGVKLDGGGASLHASKGPLIVVRTDEPVTIKNLQLEITDEEAGKNESCFYQEQKKGSLTFENVKVQGPHEETFPPQCWHLPGIIQVRSQPGGRISFWAQAPEPCTIVSNIPGITPVSKDMPAGGLQQVEFHLAPDWPPHRVINGQIDFVPETGNAQSTQLLGWTREHRNLVVKKSPWKRIKRAVASGIILCVFAYAGWRGFETYSSIPVLQVSPEKIDLGVRYYSSDVYDFPDDFPITVRWQQARVPAELTAKLILTGKTDSLSETITFDLLTTNLTDEVSVIHLFENNRLHSLEDKEWDLSGTIQLETDPQDVQVFPESIPLQLQLKPRL